MSIPTPYEETGEWTPLAVEEAWLEQIDGVGGAFVEEVARSGEDRPIWAVTLGTGTSHAVILCLQHANEPATREVAHKMIRDLAYRTEPWMETYLAGQKVTFITNANPDGFAHGTRNPPTGDSLNMDWLRLRQPETRTISARIEQWDPDIVMDAHETSGQPVGDWRPQPGGHPAEYSGLRALATEYVDEVEGILDGNGWETAWYPVTLIAWASLSTLQTAKGRVGILSETVSHSSRPVSQRLEISYIAFTHLLQWHQERLDDILQARADAAADAVERPVPTPIPSSVYIPRASPRVTFASSYVLTEPVPQYLLDGHGIVVDGGQVAVQQAARAVVTALLDPLSFERAVDAMPVAQPDDDAAGHGPRVVVMRDGVRSSAALEVPSDSAGARYVVQKVIVQQGGVRHVIG